MISLLVFSEDHIIFITEVYDVSHAYTLSLWYSSIYVRAVTFLALIPDELGILLKFYETYIKLWLPAFSVHLLQSLGELSKKTIFLKTTFPLLVILLSQSSARNLHFNEHPRDFKAVIPRSHLEIHAVSNLHGTDDLLLSLHLFRSSFQLLAKFSLQMLHLAHCGCILFLLYRNCYC